LIIFDTNILVSAALLSGSRADLCVRTVLAHPLPLIFSKTTYDELADVLLAPSSPATRICSCSILGAASVSSS
jgi:predicted nucleic acid-binding protein